MVYSLKLILNSYQTGPVFLQHWENKLEHINLSTICIEPIPNYIGPNQTIRQKSRFNQFDLDYVYYRPDTHSDIPESLLNVNEFEAVHHSMLLTNLKDDWMFSAKC